MCVSSGAVKETPLNSMVPPAVPALRPKKGAGGTWLSAASAAANLPARDSGEVRRRFHVVRIGRSPAQMDRLAGPIRDLELHRAACGNRPESPAILGNHEIAGRIRLDRPLRRNRKCVGRIGQDGSLLAGAFAACDSHDLSAVPVGRHFQAVVSHRGGPVDCRGLLRLLFEPPIEVCVVEIRIGRRELTAYSSRYPGIARPVAGSRRFGIVLPEYFRGTHERS